MKIIATLTASDGRCLGQAVGLGSTSTEAVEAVLISGERFAGKEHVSSLDERIREAVCDPPPNAFEADFEDRV